MNSLKRLVFSFESYYPGHSISYQADVIVNSKPDPNQRVATDSQTPEISPLLENRHEKSLMKQSASQVSSVKHESRFKFVLYTIFVRPLLLAWLLLTFPFLYFFGSEYPSTSVDNSMATDSGKERIDEQIALLKKEKLIANNIKTPTASKYILPPPPRLFPLSRNPEKRRRKKTLMLDLDETLIHSLSRGTPRSLGSSGSCHMIELKVNNVATLYFVYKRPFCDFFLKEASKWFELQIFTASVREYADPIIDWLESGIVDHKTHAVGNSQVFTKRYYRSDCSYRPGVGYIKDLSLFFPKQDDLKNVIILDNSPVSYALHENNAVTIEGWINDQGDRDLLNLLPLLYSLSLCIDVRFVLGLRSGEKTFENL